MKLATIRRGASKTVALVNPNGIPVDLGGAYALAGIRSEQAPRSMLELIENWSAQEGNVRKAAASLDDGKGFMNPGSFEWCPPVPNPSKILGCAINNSGLNNLATAFAANPPFFVKLPSALVGQDQAIVIRPDYGLTHPEGELAVIIGKRCKRLAPEQVQDAIFGYTIINDITSITLKSEDTYVFPNPGITPAPAGFEFGEMHLVYHARSKGADTFGPCGPWLVTRDEIPDPNKLDVKVWMGDELCASDNTSNLRFRIEEVIAWLTRYVTLEPGDMVHMGTAARGKYGLRELDFQRWDGPCVIEISGVGKLSNPVVREDLEGRPVPKLPFVEKTAWPPRIATK